MLYIESIDSTSVRFGEAVGGGTKFKVYPKTMEASSDEENRVWIRHDKRNEFFLNSGEVSNINLDGVVHPNAEAFVVAFNIMINS